MARLQGYARWASRASRGWNLDLHSDWRNIHGPERGAAEASVSVLWDEQRGKCLWRPLLRWPKTWPYEGLAAYTPGLVRWDDGKTFAYFASHVVGPRR